MSVTIYKIKETYPKSSRMAVVKKSVAIICDTYRDALQELEKLKFKNKKENVTFLIGDIYR
jgi:hypothetical protein